MAVEPNSTIPEPVKWCDIPRSDVLQCIDSGGGYLEHSLRIGIRKTRKSIAIKLWEYILDVLSQLKAKYFSKVLLLIVIIPLISKAVDVWSCDYMYFVFF